MLAAAKLHRHVVRKRTGRFLAEGPNLVEAALRRGAVSDVFATRSAAERYKAIIDAIIDAAGVDLHLVTDRAAKVLSDTVTPVGLVAVCERPRLTLEQVVAGQPRLIAIGVGLSEPGNAGTLVRLADAMAADAVVLAGHSVDPYNAKCLRASAGSIFAIPVLSDVDPLDTVSLLIEAGLQVLATTLDGETGLDDVEPLLTQPTAWLFGTEAHGLADDVATAASRRVRIPMAGHAESLNVAAAAAICLYQSFRAQHR